MDELVGEFLTETNESLSVLDLELVKLEQDPNNKEIISSIFRVMHTIKGTCGFLGLPRLEKVAHASENVLGKLRDGTFLADQSVVSLILESIDRIKQIIGDLEKTGAEPAGDDTDLKNRLNALAEGGAAPAAAAPAATTTASPAPTAATQEQPAPATPISPPPLAADKPADIVPAAAISQEAKTEAINQGLKAADNVKGDAGGGSAANQSIRINLNVLEDLMQKASELVLVRNQLVQITRKINDTELATPLQKLSHITTDLQEGVMKTRMQPIGAAWQKFPRLIRDLSVELKKKIELKMIGEETEMDRQLLEMVKDPLTHMVRNSVDHGLEPPEDRKAAGKPETGTVTLSATHESGHIMIKIIDDGRGLPIEKIKKKAVQNGLVTEQELAKLSDSQIYQYIFKPGFSTAEKVTSVSGRGVGMDVVKTNIEKIGGTVELSSVVGKGSTFTIKIPLTLAIISALIVESKKEKFAIPQIRVNEIVRIGTSDKSLDNNVKLDTLNNIPVLRLRGKLLSLISLSKVLGLDKTESGIDTKKSNYIVICEVGSQSFGLIVDKVFHTEEIVVKPVSPPVQKIEVYSGNTILGDGSVIMILDANGILKSIGNVSLESKDSLSDADSSKGKGEQKVTFLVFNAWTKSPQCIPLELVSRIEELDLSKAEWSGDHKVMQYRDDLMRLTCFDTSKPIPENGVHTVIVFSDEGKILGLIVENIIDIAEEEISSKQVSGDAGFLGSIVIKERTTDLIDISYLFTKCFGDYLANKNTEKEKSDSNQKQVLLIDDSPFFRKFMKPLLMANNYNVTTSDSAIKALELLNNPSTKYDVVVTDIDMPGMNGIEFTKKFKSDQRFAGIPVIALTSYSSEDLASNSKDVNFDGYISKANRNSLSQKISEILK